MLKKLKKRINIYYLFLVLSILFLVDKNLFADKILSLNEAETIALKNSFDLKNKKMQLRLTNISKWEAFRNFLPRFSVIYQNDKIINENNNTTKNHILGFRVSQILFDGGKSIMSYRIIKLDDKITRTNIVEIERNIIVAVRESYFRVLGAKLNVEIAQASLKKMNEEIKLTEAEVRLGQRTLLELLEMKSKFSEVELQLLSNENTYKVELMKFRFVIGEDINSKIFIKGEIKENFKPQKNLPELNTLIKNAITNRSELKRLGYEIEQEKVERFLREYDYLPTLSVSFENKWFDEDFPLKKREWSFFFRFSFFLGGNSFNSNSYYKKSINPATTMIGVDNDIEILENPFKSLRNRTESDIKYFTAKDKFNEYVKKIKLDLNEAYKNYELSLKIYETMVKKFEVEELRYKILKESINAGVRRKSDLAEAEVEFLKTRVGLSDALVQYLINISKLELISGYEFGKLGMYEKFKKIFNN